MDNMTLSSTVGSILLGGASYIGTPVARDAIEVPTIIDMAVTRNTVLTC